MRIGDVSGKGVPAALTMAQVLAAFRLFARDLSAPAEVLRQLIATHGTTDEVDARLALLLSAGGDYAGALPGWLSPAVLSSRI